MTNIMTLSQALQEGNKIQQLREVSPDRRGETAYSIIYLNNIILLINF